MPEGRMLSKSIAWSEQVGSVSFVADYLFTRMIPHLDSAGRMPGAPKAVKAMACPLRDEVTVEAVTGALEELVAAGLVVWYRVGQQHFVEFPGFANHQRGARLDREAASRIPAASDEGTELVRTYSGPTPEFRGTDSKFDGQREVKGSEVKGTPAASRRSAAGVPSWPAEGSVWWLANVGAMNPGRFGKGLSDLVALHGWPAVRSDLEKWVAERKQTGKPAKLEWYASEASSRITAPPAPPIVDAHGCLTDYGERITRPDAVRA